MKPDGDSRITITVRRDRPDRYVAEIAGLPGSAAAAETVADALRGLASNYEGIRETLVALDRELRIP